jgi:hypothetical protein
MTAMVQYITLPIIQIGMAATYPEPEEKNVFMQNQMYDWNVPPTNRWPSFTQCKQNTITSNMNGKE